MSSTRSIILLLVASVLPSLSAPGLEATARGGALVAASVAEMCGATSKSLSTIEAGTMVATSNSVPISERGGHPSVSSDARPDGARARAQDTFPLVVFLGDSLTAGLGVEKDETYPAILRRTLERTGQPFRSINAGVSGDTTAGGRGRLDWLLAQHPDVIVLELGANDGLRGLPLDVSKENLRRIILKARSAGVAVILVGMMLPTNYGPDYTRGFAAMFPDLAKETHVPLVPFLLAGVAARPDLNQPDGLHPTAKGYERVAENVRPFLVKALEKLHR